MPFTPDAAVLAGGESRRMGRDKARLPYRGEPLLERIVGLVRSVADTVCVAGRTKPPDWDGPPATFLEDRVEEVGPIEGVRRSLEYLESPTLVVACDMPLLDRAILGWFVDQYRTWRFALDDPETRDGFVAARGGRIEPLFAIYHPALGPRLEHSLQRGARSLRRIVETGAFEQCPVPSDRADRLRNVNTPRDYEELP